MRAGIRPIGNAVAVDVEIAAEVLSPVEFGRSHDFTAVVSSAVVPGERPAQSVIHADVEIEHDENRRLQSIGEVEGLGSEIKGLGGIFGKQQHVLRVAMRCISARDEVALLGAGRHAGRGPGALHVEDDRRNFGEIGKPEEFLHQ